MATVVWANRVSVIWNFLEVFLCFPKTLLCMPMLHKELVEVWIFFLPKHVRFILPKLR